MSGYELLLAQLDVDRGKADHEFHQLRQKLVKVFECRRCFDPEACADEAFSRIARRLEEGETIKNLKNYIAGVAKRIAQEKYRKPQMESIDDVTDGGPIAKTNAETVLIEGMERERCLSCLRKCLEHLAPESRDLALSYYEEEKGQKIAHRKGLAKRLGINEETLRKRVERLRRALESCVTKCLHPVTQ
jgi:RNA polymerase sigma factor (sigma-70 family)